MSRNLVLYFFTQVLFILKVSSQGQSVKQYFLTRVGPQSQTGLSQIPAFNPIKQPSTPNVLPGQQIFIRGPQTSEIVSRPPISSNLHFLPAGLSSIAPVSQFISTGTPNPGFVAPQLPCQSQLPQSALAPGPIKLLPPNPPILPTPPIPSPTSTEPKCPNSPVMDTHVLNNLAIALQLLIVNNILNKPLPEPSVGSKSPFEALHSLVPYSSPIPELTNPSPTPSEYGSISYNQFTPMPNANFLGGSNLINTSPMLGVSAFKPPTRSSLTLMSPYEALGTNSPFSDPILSSPYAPTSAKADFQSPYASILADGNNDLFSMVDLY